MGAPILWAPGIFPFFLQDNLHVHKIPRLGGGKYLGFWGGGSADFATRGFRGETGIAKTMKTIQTSTNKGVECWISGNHGNHSMTKTT